MKQAGFFTSLHLLLFVGVSSFAVTTAADPQEPVRFAADRPVDSLHVKLELQVDVARKHVDGKVVMDLVALREVSSITLDAVDLETVSATLAREGQDSSPVRFRNDGEHIEILPATSLKTGEKVRLTVRYAVDKPKRGLHFYGKS